MSNDTKKHDRLGDFLTQYDEYLDGRCSYTDLPTFKLSDASVGRRVDTQTSIPTTSTKKK